MNNILPSELGSLTAKNGFKNEQDVVDAFNAWKTSSTAQKWLQTLGYSLNNITNISAKKISGHHKADIQLEIFEKKSINRKNIQVKLVSNEKGFNQIDKRWLKNYQELWNIPDNIFVLLQYFTGELSPYKTDVRDSRRMFLNELSVQEQNSLLTFFNSNKLLIINDILKGRGEFATEWFLVVKKTDTTDWVLKPISTVIQHYAEGNVFITPQGSLKLGKITVQRKGGDAGRKTSQMLQFKIDPTDLFN